MSSTWRKYQITLPTPVSSCLRLTTFIKLYLCQLLLPGVCHRTQEIVDSFPRNATNCKTAWLRNLASNRCLYAFIGSSDMILQRYLLWHPQFSFRNYKLSPSSGFVMREPNYQSQSVLILLKLLLIAMVRTCFSLKRSQEGHYKISIF